MPERLLNKVAVVSAGDSAIGRAVALRFLHEGAKVALFARKREALEDVAQAAPARTLVVPGNAGRADHLRELVTATSRRFGPAHVVVTSLGEGRCVPLGAVTPAAAQEIFQQTVGAAFETVRSFLPQLADAASLVFLTGRRDSPPPHGWGAYLAAQSALVTLAQGLSVELAPRRIRANCISVDVTQASPTRPEDVADAAVFLASDAAAGITGQELAVGTCAAPGGIDAVE
jgi:NAD(P)-dependent dehydrogenase (short-subunit alcohol dehydrogenase family)